MAKKVKSIVNIQLPAAKATPGPPVGSSLGPHGINIGQFVKDFNAKTAGQEGLIIPVVMTIYEDRSFDFIKRFDDFFGLFDDFGNDKAVRKFSRNDFIDFFTRECGLKFFCHDADIEQSGHALQ